MMMAVSVSGCCGRRNERGCCRGKHQDLQHHGSFDFLLPGTIRSDRLNPERTSMEEHWLLGAKSGGAPQTENAVCASEADRSLMATACQRSSNVRSPPIEHISALSLTRPRATVNRIPGRAGARRVIILGFFC